MINLPSDSGLACPRRVDKWNFLIKMQIGNVTIYFCAAARRERHEYEIRRESSRIDRYEPDLNEKKVP